MEPQRVASAPGAEGVTVHGEAGLPERMRALRNLYRIFLGLVAVAYLAALWQGWGEALEDARTSLTHINSVLVQATRSTLTTHELVLRGLGAELVTQGALEEPARGRQIIERMKAIDSGMVGFGLARPDGQLVLVSGIPAGTVLPNLLQQAATAMDFRRSIETDRAQFGRPYLMPSLGRWVIPIRVPVRDGTGALRAVMTAGYDLAGGSSLFARMTLPDQVTAILVREDGYLQFLQPSPPGATDADTYGKPVSVLSAAELRALPDGIQFGAFHLPKRERTEYIVYERIAGQDLIAATSIPRAVIVAQWRDRSLVITGLLLLFLAGSGWSYRRAGRQLARSDAERAASAEALAASNLRLSLINQMSGRLHQCMAVHAIAGQTLDMLMEYARPSMARFYLLTADGTQLELAATVGQGITGQAPASSVAAAGSFSERALREDAVIVIRDAADDERVCPDIRQAIQAAGMTAGLVIPVAYNDEPLGSIALLYRQYRDWSGTELDTLHALGKTVSLAIANARHVEDLAFQARHDPLTGLANRVVLHERLAAWAAAPAEGRQGALILLDLDHFKEINDTLGHHVGDVLLRGIGPRLAAGLGTTRHTLVRLGGDEFAIVVEGIGAPEDAMALALALSDAVRRPYQVENMSLEVEASFGVALFPARGADGHELLRAADVAMYEAKHSGVSVMLYSAQLDRHSPERLALMLELGPAIQHGQLVLHYQPKLDVGQRRITGFEALVRWNHPTRGLLYPDRFLPFAETSEVIHHLTRDVLRQALAQQRAWKAEGLRFSVAVNLSARNLIDEQHVASLLEVLREFDLEEGDLELEVTESALMYNPESAIELLARIAGQGVALSIDDFGTGFSSLSYLRRMRLQSLKIDRVFVQDMLANPQDAIIVRSTIGLAHNLGLKVVAEGVEDEATLEALARMDCDLVQGYQVSKPRPWPELVPLVLADGAKPRAA